MMKTAMTAIAAAAMLGGAANAADSGEIRSAYSAAAFENDSDDWRRITSNRIDACSKFGKKKHTRLGILVDRYQAIGDAIDTGSDDAVMTAAKSLSKAINANERFAACWDEVSRRNGVTREFRSMIADI